MWSIFKLIQFIIIIIEFSVEWQYINMQDISDVMMKFKIISKLYVIAAVVSRVENIHLAPFLFLPHILWSYIQWVNKYS